MATLHMGSPRIAPSDLEPRLRQAIRRVEVAQRDSALWEHRPGHRVLDLGDDLRFVPDEEDAMVGMVGQIFGGIIAVFGLALLGVLLEGDQAEPWMRWVAPVLLLGGGYLLWSGRRKTREARAEPRRTGAYLFDDLVMHVSEHGCRTLPRERVRGFDYRATGSEGSSRTMFVRFVDDGGAEREEALFRRDATATLEAWRTT